MAPLESDESSSKSKLTALVVERDSSVAGMVCYFLELQGIQCLHTASADDAWETLTHRPVDMAVIDLRLQDRDGWWLVEHIRADRQLGPLPVVVLTLSSDQEFTDRARSLESECVLKPFSYDALNEGLERAAEVARHGR